MHSLLVNSHSLLETQNHDATPHMNASMLCIACCMQLQTTMHGMCLVREVDPGTMHAANPPALPAALR